MLPSPGLSQFLVPYVDLESIMWTVAYSSDPLCPSIRGEDGIRSAIAECSVDIKTYLGASSYDAFLEGGRTAKVALSDKIARSLADVVTKPLSSKKIPAPPDGTHTISIEPLYKMLSTVDPHRALNASARHHLKRSMTVQQATQRQQSSTIIKSRVSCCSYVASSAENVCCRVT